MDNIYVAILIPEGCTVANSRVYGPFASHKSAIKWEREYYTSHPLSTDKITIRRLTSEM